MDEALLSVLRCQLTYQGQVVTNAEARFSNSLRPRKPEGSLRRTAQDAHLDSHAAPELCPKWSIVVSFTVNQKWARISLTMGVSSQWRVGGVGVGVLWRVHGEGEGSTLRRNFSRTLTPAVGSPEKSVRTFLKTRREKNEQYELLKSPTELTLRRRRKI